MFVHAILYSLTLLSVDSVDRQTPKNYHTPNQSQEKRNDCRRTKRIHTDNSMMVGWLVGSCWNNFNWIFSTNSFIYLFIHLNFANINRDYFFLKWETTKRKWFFFFLTHSKEDCSRFNMKFSFDCWFRTTVDLYYSIQRFTMCFYFFSFSLRHTIHTQICTHTYTHTRTHAPRSFILWRRTYTFAFASMVFSLNVPSVVWILMLNMVH